MAHFDDRVAYIVQLHQLVALLVDNAALVVGHVIVIQQVLAHVEVMRFDLALRILDGAVEHAGLDGFIVLHAEALHQQAHAVGSEDAHQVVFQAQVKP